MSCLRVLNAKKQHNRFRGQKFLYWSHYVNQLVVGGDRLANSSGH